MVTRADRRAQERWPSRTREDTQGSWRGNTETSRIGSPGLRDGPGLAQDVEREVGRIGRWFTPEGFYEDGRVATRADIEYHVGVDPQRFVWVYDDFLGPHSTTMDGLYGFTSQVNGTGAQTKAQTGTAQRWGIVECDTGTTSTGDAGLASAADMVLLGGGAVRWVSSVYIPTLSTSSQRFITTSGLMDNMSGTIVDGVYFDHSDNITSGNWRCATRSNSTLTAVDSGVAVTAATWYALEIRISSDAGYADFFIDGVPVGTSTTNIPTGTGRETGICALNIRKTVGTTARTAWVDYAGMHVILREPR